MKQYFYITIHFVPRYEESLFKKIQNNVYKNIVTGELYQKRLLYDFGWGQEEGFELLPALSFDSLIRLVEQPTAHSRRILRQKYTKEEIRQADILRSNLYGAVAIIMQDHVEEFIDFLSKKNNTDYFLESSICENYKCFSFDSKKSNEEGKIPGGVRTDSYEEILNKYPKWKEISSKVIELIYK